MKTFEVNFDGLVGPTHNYSGLALGNVASVKHAYQVSNPKKAALQGLAKMKLLMELGLKQAVLPPQERPFFPILDRLGFKGNTIQTLQAVKKTNPDLLRSVYSSSSMWTANAATVSPSFDTRDNLVHITPANLITHFHRSIEADQNYFIFKKIFADPKYFKVHKPLPRHALVSDEGAANHTRFCKTYQDTGFNIFVYGKTFNQTDEIRPKKYPARQTKEASEAIARLHELDADNTLFVKQNPDIIDLGVFHNDVISVGNQNVFLYHEDAFQTSNNIFEELKDKLSFETFFIPVLRTELSITEAVQTFLFNSQLITLPDGTMVLIAPIESKEQKSALHVIERIIKEDNPIKHIHFVDLRQSMQNGGGPACLRLRVVLTEKEIEACHPNIFLNPERYEQLTAWVNKHFRDKIEAEDLLDPLLIEESRSALDQLTQILDLGFIYSFQK